MYILEPIIHETIWGGNKLKKYYDFNGKIGHLYLVNGHLGMSNRILNGDLRGKSIYEAFPVIRKEWNLDEFEEFPLTIALVDATDDLSIQVHPDDVIARKLEGEKIGKTESWLFINAPISGWIYGGCTCKTKEELKKAIDYNRTEEIVAHFPVKKMDCVTINAGTLHSMSAGSLVYEIEYGSDYTYRFYDFNRTYADGRNRELHIEKALEAIKIGMIPQKDTLQQDEWLQGLPYTITYKKSIKKYINLTKEIQLFTVLSGKGICDNINISSGMSILLFPNEELNNINIAEAIIASLVR